MNKIQLIEISLDQLKENFREIIKEQMRHASTVSEAALNKYEYLTRNETAKLLKISLPTLNTWTKTGKLLGYRIGSRVLYKKAELDQSLKEIKHI
jgi:excisionase family DNA binding protein